MKPAGLILAGGLSRRMGGGDKALRTLAGRPILAHVIARLAPQVAALALNANGDPARFAEFGLEVIADSVPDHPGPLAGVLAGMEWAAERRGGAIVTVPADAPFLPIDLVDRLVAVEKATGAALVIAASGGRRHHVVGLWSLSLAEPLRAALSGEGLRKVGDFVDRHAPAVADFPDHPFDPFHNINRESDLEAAERLAVEIS